MDLDQKLLLTRLTARNNELEMWLAMLIVELGIKTDSGYRLRYCVEHADALRAKLPRVEATVGIDLDHVREVYTLDAL